MLAARTTCNTTLDDAYGRFRRIYSCLHLADSEAVVEDPLVGGLTLHHFLIFISLGSTAVAVLASQIQIWLQSTHYLRPEEQRQWATLYTSELTSANLDQNHSHHLHGNCVRVEQLPQGSLLP